MKLVSSIPVITRIQNVFERIIQALIGVLLALMVLIVFFKRDCQVFPAIFARMVRGDFSFHAHMVDLSWRSTRFQQE